MTEKIKEVNKSVHGIEIERKRLENEYLEDKFCFLLRKGAGNLGKKYDNEKCLKGFVDFVTLKYKKST
jgi:hypothetical protein